MESNKLTTIDNKLPLRAYPENKLDEVLQTEFKFWLANLLSIKADNEGKLDAAMPAIKKHFWSLGFTEIKKAFEMYVDGELHTKPVSNYFDRVLVGKIFTDYKQQKPALKPLSMKSEPSPQEIKKNAVESILDSFELYKNEGKITGNYSVGFDRLYEWGILPAKGSNEKADKKYGELLALAHMELVAPLIDERKRLKDGDLTKTPEAKKIRERILELNQSYNHTEIQSRFRCLVLEGFFSKVTREQLIKLMK